MSYTEMKPVGDEAERIAEAYFRAKGFHFSRTGIEQHLPAQALKTLANLSEGDYPSLKAVRFLPDYCVERPEGRFYVEVKATLYVEQMAYEAYLERAKTTPVYLFVMCGAGDMRAVKLTDIVWQFDTWRAGTNGGGSGMKCNAIDMTKTPNQKLPLPVELS
jgi:hypothetical protein